MNQKIFFAAMLLLLLAAGVSAQEQSVEKPAARQYDTGHCYDYQVKMLSQAANVGNTLEDMQKYEIAARAYGQLDALEQTC